MPTLRYGITWKTSNLQGDSKIKIVRLDSILDSESKMIAVVAELYLLKGI
jgi:hypothetical protein